MLRAVILGTLLRHSTAIHGRLLAVHGMAQRRAACQSGVREKAKNLRPSCSCHAQRNARAITSTPGTICSWGFLSRTKAAAADGEATYQPWAQTPRIQPERGPTMRAHRRHHAP